jgi:hypothetical protein
MRPAAGGHKDAPGWSMISAMAGRGRLLAILALVGAVAVLVGVRVLSDPAGPGGGEAGDPAPVTTPTPTTASPGAGDTDGIRFTDVTEEAGLAVDHSDEALFGEQAMTAGMAVADVDADGDLDVLLTRVGATDALLLNDGEGVFSDGSQEAGLTTVAEPVQGSSAAAFADVDADGDLDLFTTGAGTNGNTLWVNEEGRFTDRTAERGLGDLPAVAEGELAQMHGASFADPDRDGDLDLVVTHWDDGIATGLADDRAGEVTGADDPNGSAVCARAEWLRRNGFPRSSEAPPNRSRLYRNDGTGTFTDATASSGIDFGQVIAFTPTFSDVDGDGWEDLLVTGDFCTSRVLRNTSGDTGGLTFADVTATVGVGTDENGMGSVVADVDHDGDPDWFVTSIGWSVEDGRSEEARDFGYGVSGNRMWLNDGDGTFRDATDDLGLRWGWWGWGAAIEDFANNGDLAVAMTNGYDIGGTVEEPDDPTSFEAFAWRTANDPTRFWVPAEDGYLEASGAVGIEETGLGRALVAFDMDRDGDLDLLEARFGDTPRMWRNDSPARHWLTVRLDDPGTPGNRSGLGARVVVVPEGGEPRTDWVHTQGSYESQVPAEAHFGLGDAGTARVEVTWPGETTPQVLEEVAADRVQVVTRG